MPATCTELTRVFEYNGTEIPDPNPRLTIREVQDVLSAQYPELANAKPRSETKADKGQPAQTRVTFTVPAGTKG